MKKRKLSPNTVRVLRELPNVGPAIEKDLHFLGIDSPDQLKSADPGIV